MQLLSFLSMANCPEPKLTLKILVQSQLPPTTGAEVMHNFFVTVYCEANTSTSMHKMLDTIGNSVLSALAVF